MECYSFLEFGCRCDKDVCALADKLPGGREADAAIAARNERDFSFKLAHVFLLRVTE